jgi:hypothetical protein
MSFLTGRLLICRIKSAGDWMWNTGETIMKGCYRTSSRTRGSIYVKRNTDARSPNHRYRVKAISTTYWSVCACILVPGRVGVCMCVSACSLANPAATSMRHNVKSFVAPLARTNFLALSHKWCNFREKGYWSWNLCFDFLYNVCLKHFPF